MPKQNMQSIILSKKSRTFYRSLLLSFFLIVSLVFVSLKQGIGEKDTYSFEKHGSEFLEQYCFDCHAGDQAEAGLAFDTYQDKLSLIQDYDVWERVLDMLETGQMPPDGNDQPTIEEADAFVQHVKEIFDEASRTAKPDPGKITVRRLNRVEYKNSVRDLLGADFDPTVNFPTDDVGHGFDNIGDVLTMSPLLMERYLDAAEAIATRVIVLDPPKPSTNYINTKYLNPRHDDVGDARFRILDPNASEQWKSGPLFTAARPLKLLPDVETYLRATFYAETETDTPVQVALYIQGKDLEDVSPQDELAKLIGYDTSTNNRIKILNIFEVTSRDPEKLQTVRHLVSGIENIDNAGIAIVRPENGIPQVKLHLRAITSLGPLETRPQSHLEIIACTPDISQTEQTREVLTRLLRKAYRRPPTNQEIDQLVQYVESVQADGVNWEEGIQRAIKVILCSPKFLFRLELDDRPQTEEPQPIDEFHLASRLSYFLWSSIPDDELLDLAEENQLTASLEEQVKRMLSDPKATELATNFGSQWLQIQRLDTATPDPERFPTFNTKLRADMLKETEMFLESIFREDRSILELLTADYTFLNQRLSGHYEIWKDEQGEPIQGNTFRKVALNSGNNYFKRGGILTQASVLTVTSNPNRTSPVKRGRWVLEQILGTPPPPPPPDVPELEEEHDVITGSTLRERLEQHRDDSGCANCHAKMDPIGFAMENYDAIGKHRTKDGEQDIDTAGQLPDGTSFEGISDLKQILVNRKTQFARCLTEKMLIFALGRGLEYYDRPTIDRIVTALEANEYRFSVLITEIVKSDPFRLRRGQKDNY